MECYSIGERRYITLELTMEFFNGRGHGVLLKDQRSVILELTMELFSGKGEICLSRPGHEAL
jgi:hypothetical protein